MNDLVPSLYNPELEVILALNRKYHSTISFGKGADEHVGPTWNQIMADLEMVIYRRCATNTGI
jgi:hypothetical protein